MAWRSLRYNKPEVTDREIFAEQPIRRMGEVYELVEGKEQGILPLNDWAMGRWYEEGMEKEDFFRHTGTVGFLVLRGDTLLYEYYDPNFSPTYRFNSFSVSKVYVSVLTGIALDEGHILSLDQSIADYIPDLIDSSLCSVKIRNLLQMTSGIKTSKSIINPWATTTRLYYGDNLYKVIRKLRLEHPPSTRWRYQNINTQLLGMILERATGRSLSQYLEEKIWGPMGMEADAGWSLHENTNVEKSFCCLNARARDFARFGLLLLNRGKWRGQQLIPEDYLWNSTHLDTLEASRQRYQNCFYLTAEESDYYGEGLLGQFTYVAPEPNMVVVRIGKKVNPKIPWYDMFRRIVGLDEKPVPVELDQEQLMACEGTWEFGTSNFGDSTMFGKQAVLEVDKKGLKVEGASGKPWIATPSSDTTFFNEEYGRNLVFSRDSVGSISGLRWSRRGNEWNLSRKKGL